MRSIYAVLTLLFTAGHAWALELQDPTRPAWHLKSTQLQAVSTKSLVPHRLTMIISGPRENIAIVNGLRVKKGDRVGGAAVLKVNTSDVELERDGSRFVVELLPLQVKTAADVTSKEE